MRNSLAEAGSLRDALMDHGVGRIVSPYTGKVGGVSIELQPGRGTGGQFYDVLDHHTAGSMISATNLTPSLYICKHGRSDLQGPLCNCYGGGDFFLRIITLEWANHPGLGGPVTWAGVTVPKDNGRPYLLGNEFDWDGVSRWPAEYREWMARVNAGQLDWMGRPADAQGEHKTWAPNRKVDRNDHDRPSSITLTRSVWDDNGGDDDVPNTEQEIKTWVNQCLEAKLGLRSGQNMGLAVFGSGDNSQVFNRTVATNNPASLASMVLVLLDLVRAQGVILGKMATDLSDDEQNVIANANARAEEIKLLISAESAEGDPIA